MATMNRILKITDKYNLGGMIDITDVYSPARDEFGVRVTYDKKFDDRTIKQLGKYKSVMVVDNAMYRYAPEIQKGYIVFKGKMR